MLKIFERFGRYATFPLGFLLSILINRRLGIEAVGEYNYWGTVISLASAVALFGTGQSMWSLYGDRKEQDISLIFFQFFLCSVPLISVFVVVNFIFSEISPIKALLLFFSIFLMALNAYVKNFEVLVGRLYRNYLNDLAYYAFAIFLVMAGFAVEWDILIIYSGSLFFAFILFFRDFARSLVARRWVWLINLTAFRRSMYALSGVFIGLAAYRAVILFAGNQFSSDQLGYFTLVYVMVDAFVTLQTSLMVADMHAIRKGEEGAVKKSLLYQIGIGTAGAGGLLIAGEWIVSILYQVSTVEVRPLLVPFSVVLLMSGCYKFTQNYALAKGRDVDYMLGNVGLFMIVIVAIVVIRPGSILSLAWCYGFALTVSTMLGILRAFRVQHGS